MSKHKCVIFAILLHTSLVLATTKCFYCRGINCQRISYQAEEECADQLDVCASVFRQGVLLAQGCLEQLNENCDDARLECAVCVSPKCNNKGSSRASCIQCKDSEDQLCKTAPESLSPKICEVSRSGKSFCYATRVGQSVERGCSLGLKEQLDCLNNDQCQLCDPLEQPECNNQLIDTNTSTTETPESSTTKTTEPPESSTTKTTERPSSSTSDTTDRPSSSTTNTTETPSSSTTETPNTSTTAKPNQAGSFRISIFVILAPLAFVLKSLINF